MNKYLLIIFLTGFLDAPQIIAGQTKNLTDITVSVTLYTPAGAIAAEGEVCVLENREAGRIAIGDRCVRTGGDGSFLLRLRKIKNNNFGLALPVSTGTADSGLIDVPSMEITNKTKDTDLVETETKLGLRSRIGWQMRADEYPQPTASVEKLKYEKSLEMCRINAPFDCDRWEILQADGLRKYEFTTPEAGFILKIKVKFGSEWCEWQAASANNHGVKTLQLNHDCRQPVCIALTK